MKDHKLIVGHRYLIRSKDTTITFSNFAPKEWTIIEESVKAYKYKTHEANKIFPNPEGDWILKEDFILNYEVIEDLDINKKNESSYSEWVNNIVKKKEEESFPKKEFNHIKYWLIEDKRTDLNNPFTITF